MDISKELLSEVLIDVNLSRLCEWHEVEDNLLSCYYDCGDFDEQGRPTGLGYEINIYELAHKCKEWAFNNGYCLESSYRRSSGVCKIRKSQKDKKGTHREDTEQEAIFKACQWVLDNRRNNMDYLKIIRIKDKRIFWIRTYNNGLQWLCTRNQRSLKPLKEVKDLEIRFRKYIIGVDND